MNVQEYFENKHGLGVLSTSDKNGEVNAAVYARPHCFEDGTVGFIMPDRLTHSNLQQNGKAVFLFKEAGESDHSYEGKRLYLEKLREEDDQEYVNSLRRRVYGDDRDGRFLVVFKIAKELPLVGAGPTA